MDLRSQITGLVTDRAVNPVTAKLTMLEKSDLWDVLWEPHFTWKQCLPLLAAEVRIHYSLRLEQTPTWLMLTMKPSWGMELWEKKWKSLEMWNRTGTTWKCWWSLTLTLWWSVLLQPPTHQSAFFLLRRRCKKRIVWVFFFCTTSWAAMKLAEKRIRCSWFRCSFSIYAFQLHSARLYTSLNSLTWVVTWNCDTNINNRGDWTEDLIAVSGTFSTGRNASRLSCWWSPSVYSDLSEAGSL